MTVFIEIIQRIGCDITADGHKKIQTAGCGGFGKVGHFSVMFFKSGFENDIHTSLKL